MRLNIQSKEHFPYDGIILSVDHLKIYGMTSSDTLILCLRILRRIKKVERCIYEQTKLSKRKVTFKKIISRKRSIVPSDSHLKIIV